jgi:hypothetical protein
MAEPDAVSQSGSQGSSADQLLHLLRHPLRRKIMRHMVERTDPLSPREASVLLRQPLSSVSYHFRLLALKKAITLVKEVPVGGTSIQHFYAPAPDILGHSWVSELLSSSMSG